MGSSLKVSQHCLLCGMFLEGDATSGAGGSLGRNLEPPLGGPGEKQALRADNVGQTPNGGPSPKLISLFLTSCSTQSHVDQSKRLAAGSQEATRVKVSQAFSACVLYHSRPLLFSMSLRAESAGTPHVVCVCPIFSGMPYLGTRLARSAGTFSFKTASSPWLRFSLEGPDVGRQMLVS